ncbi:MAG: LacI family DNA-binding transcriptional regulator, partial [Spirochaetaceae bacterium]|nr:LacI family DNA-binding transcriptional regulator [Spirochaetaceae bacterium]
MTIRDVARAAGVSTATVSRVLNGEGSVSPPTAELVRAAVAALGYRPNHVARSLKTRATRTIGVVAPELASDFFMALAESMDRELSEHGYGLIVCSSRESARLEGERLEMLSERLVDGAIVIPATGEGGHLRAALERGLPLVLVDRLVEGVDADAVLVDNEGGAYAATTALAGAGHRRIGFIGGGSIVSVARERFAGWERAMRDAGIPVEPDFVREGDLHVDSGYRA